MKKHCWFLAFCLLSVTPAFAAALQPATVSLSFDKVPVMQFVQATFKELLGSQYVVDPALVDDARRISIQVKDLPRGQVRPFVSRLLASSGIAVEERDGIEYIIPLRQASQSAQEPAGASNRPVQPVAQPQAAISPLESKLLPPVTPVEKPVPVSQLYSPRSRSVGQLQVIANSLLSTTYKDVESVVLTGTEERVNMVRKLLEQYDQRPAEVMIRAVVYEFTDTANDGFNFFAAINALSGKLNIEVGVANPLQSVISFKNTTLNAIVSAISSDSRFKLVTSPLLRVQHGNRGRLTVGSETPVLDSVQLDKNGNSVQSVQYRAAGVILDVLPTVMQDRVEMTLNAEVSSFTSTTTSSINSPTLLKRSFTSTVGIDPGDLIVMGGLDEEKSTDSRTGFSFLPSWSRSHNSDTTKTQILMVMEVKKL